MPATGNTQNVIIPTPKNASTKGGLYYGPTGTTVPATLTTPANTLTQLGFLSEDGLEDTEDRPFTEFFAFGGDKAAESQDNYSLTKTFTLWEFLNPDVAKIAYGEANVTVTAADETNGTRMSIVGTANVLDTYCWLEDLFAPGGKRVQTFYPLGKVRSKDTRNTTHKEILAHRITVSFLPDGSGNYFYTKTDDGVLDAS